MSRAALSLFCLFLLTVGAAQSTAERAVALAEQHPAFALVLGAREGYRAAAYDSQNAYGIWRVQFWDAEDDLIGWLDLDPNQEKVFSWEYKTGLNEQEQAEAEKVIRELIRQSPEMQVLVEGLSDADISVGYNEAGTVWWGRVQRGPDSVVVVFRPEQDRVRTLENLQVERIFFPEMIPFEAWQSGHEAGVVALAFRDRDIAEALRGKKNWTSTVTPVNDALWQVEFREGDTLLARARVNTNENVTTQVEVGEP